MHDASQATKIIGRRRSRKSGIVAAAPFLDLVIRLRGRKPFIPRGVHRFHSFEESQTWSIRMMARRSRPAHRLLEQDKE